MQEAVIRIWYTVIMKSEERLWHVNNAQRIIKETKYPKKISPTPNQRHPELLIQGSMNSSFHVGYSFIRPGDIFPNIYFLIMVSPCEL